MAVSPQNLVVSPQLPPVDAKFATSAKKGKKRKRRVFDDIIQLPLMFDILHTNKKPNSVKKNDRSHFAMKNYFDKPTNMLKTLQPRYANESAAFMVGMQRAKRKVRKEQTDLTMVADFLENRQAQDDEHTHDETVERPQPCNEQ